MAMDATGRMGPEGYDLIKRWFPDEPHRALLRIAQPSDVIQGKVATYVCKRNAILIMNAMIHWHHGVQVANG
jgi:hypothetical protein